MTRVLARSAAPLRAALASGLQALPQVAETLFLTVHPRTVRHRVLGFRHTYFLGMASVWLVLLTTGVLMMFYVRPAVPAIYRDLKDLQFTVDYGGFVRNLHRWGASAMVILVFLHMLRVFFHGAYHPPRRLTWLLGVGLFGLTLLSAHTGYLLPWDQRAYWGVSVGTTMAGEVPLVGPQLQFLMLGGNTIGPNAVLRFYVMHCLIIPAATALLVAAHLWRVRREGVHGPGEPLTATNSTEASADASDSSEPIPAYPYVLMRELIVFQWVVIGLALLALTGDAPLEAMADPLETPDPVKAPWYFVGLQELLHYFPPIVAGVIVPGLVMTVLVLVPFLPRPLEVEATGFITTARARTLAALTLVLTVVLAVAHAWIVLVPTLAIEGLALWSARRPQSRGVRLWFGRQSLIEWLIIWFVIVAATATITGTFFRGSGWAFEWPLPRTR
jgi:quinol-cytochrome oxidoreductase complex cytochrome b subunit